MVADRDAHHRRAEIKEKHAELEPIDAEMVEINGRTDESDKCCANEKAGRDPIHAVKRNAKHDFLIEGYGRQGFLKSRPPNWTPR